MFALLCVYLLSALVLENESLLVLQIREHPNRPFHLQVLQKKEKKTTHYIIGQICKNMKV